VFARSAPSRADAPRTDPASLRRALAAALRWRTLRVLPEAVPARAREAARLVPVLLHASFQHPSFRGDAPGVFGLRYRRGWAGLCRRFDLPPPWRAQRDAPLVDAVLAVPEGAVLTVLAITTVGLARTDLHRVEERAATIQALLAGGGAPCALRVVEASALARDPVLAHRLVIFGSLLAGRIPPASWSALEALSHQPIDPRDLIELGTEAPGALPALALALLAGAPAPGPLDAAARLIRRGTPARRLADPALLCARWAIEARPEHAADLELALRYATTPLLRSGPGDDAAAVLALASRMVLPLARAIQGSRRAGLGPAERARWRERVGPDLPRALVPALGARLGGGGELSTQLRAAARQHEVQLQAGAVLGRGVSPTQARVRALSVLAAAALEPLLAHAEPPWRAVVGRLAQPRERPTLLLVVEPAGPSGPPYDPLNRGPERQLGFSGGLAVRLAPGRRPSARGLTAEEVVEQLLREARAGTRVEVLASRSEAHPVAARLAQLVGLLEAQDASAVAVEAGGRVLLSGGAGVRRFSLDRIASRPRRYLADPDAPDLALSPGERRPFGLGGDAVVECRALPLDGTRAAILYTDAGRHQLREVVFLSELEDHLRESRDILQSADPRAMLAVHLADELEGLVRRAGPPGPPLLLAVRARFPWDVQVEVEGSWYGGTTGRTWREAALKLLVRWPREFDARIAVTSVNAVARGRRRGGLLALYARSLVLRRMRTHLVRTLRAYQKPRVRRSGG
jgi:hypothetical protein